MPNEMNVKKPSGRQWTKFWRIIRPLSLIALGLFALSLFVFTVFAAWVSRDLPDPNSLITREVAQSTQIYDRTGTHLLYEIHGDEKRTLIAYEDIPKSMYQAVISIEDRGFYEHNGIYWFGLARAVIVNTLKGQRISGTSTLTQQLVRNAILTTERSWIRKIKEVIISLQIERKLSKEQIIQLYLNEIPFGSNLYGIESASQSYFGKSAKDLTIDESAFLAAIIQRPEYFNPYGNGYYGDQREALKNRQHLVLEKMKEQDYINQEEYDANVAIDTLKKLKPRTVGNIEAPHFVMYVKGELVERYGISTVERGGLKVITTIDYDKQKIAEDEIVKGVESRGARYNFSNAALIALDPKTGQIMSMVGSKDYFDKSIQGEVNVTLSRNRQPGSSFKPIIYAAAFEKGYLPETKIWDVLTTFKTDVGNYEPKNYDFREHGPVTLRSALAGSLNIPAVKATYLVGVGGVIDFAEKLGYTTFENRSDFGLSIGLGGGTVTALEHANAFAAFAQDGKQKPIAAILKVEKPDGTVLEEWKDPEAKQVVEPQVARLLTDIMSDNNARTFIFGSKNSLTLPDRQVAAKTGTTNNNKDAWTAGFTPNLVSVVWVGNTDGKEMKSGADGSIIAAPIWQNYMRRATQGMEKETFIKPAPSNTDKLAILGQNVERLVKVNKLNNKLATEFTPPDLIEERLVHEAHTILYYIDKDNPLGPNPVNPAADPQFVNWEAGVQSYVQKTQWMATSTAPTESDDLFTPENKPNLTIQSPQDNTTISSRNLTIQASVESPRTIKTVSVTIDDILIGTANNYPWTIYATIPNSIESGYRTLKIRAEDELGAFDEKVIQINLTAAPDASLSGFNLLSPQRNERWSRSSFPRSFIIHSDQPTRYQRITVTLVNKDTSERILVGSIQFPTEEQTGFTLSAGPATGEYTVEAEATQKDGETIDLVTEQLKITP